MNNFNDSASRATHDEVNFNEIIGALKESRNLIAIIISVFALSSVIYSLLAPQIWTSQALMTVSESNAGSVGSGALNGLASIANLGMSEGNIEGSKALATVRSREFFNHIVVFDGVLENLMAAKSFNHKSQETIFYSKLYDASSQKWVDGKPTNWLAYKKYLSGLSIIMDNKTSFITLSMDHRSPLFAESFLSLIIEEINSLSRERDIKESEASLNYLYNELNSSKQSDIRLTISQLIESQLKKQMLARVKTDYILQSLDPPFIPEERTSPQRTSLVLISTFIGVIVAIFFTLIRFYILKNLKKFSD